MAIIVGTRKGSLVVLEELDSRIMNDGNKYKFIKVQCDCGNIEEIRKASFVAGKRMFCGNHCELKKTDYSEYIRKTFGKWTVLEFIGKKNYVPYVSARCECGKTKDLNLSQLMNGYTKSCVSCARKKDIPIGSRFDMLVVDKIYNDEKTGKRHAKCKCDCGNEKDINIHNLTRKKKNENDVRSCGCFYKLNLKGRKFGKLTVVNEAESVVNIYNGKTNVKRRWLCSCECGSKPKVISQNELLRGQKSCGCLLSSEERSKRVKGENNPMYGITGEKHPNWDPKRTHEQRQKERKDHKYYVWRRLVYERDNYICKCCGYDKGSTLVAHHIFNYKDFEELRYEVSNGITLCHTCHETYHTIYGKRTNTLEQLEEFFNTYFVRKRKVSIEDIIKKSDVKIEDVTRIKPYQVIFPSGNEERFYTYEEIQEKVGISISSSLKCVKEEVPFVVKKVFAKKNGEVIHTFKSYQEAGRYFNCSGSTISQKVHNPNYLSKIEILNDFVFDELEEKTYIFRKIEEGLLINSIAI